MAIDDALRIGMGMIDWMQGQAALPNMVFSMRAAASLTTRSSNSPQTCWVACWRVVGTAALSLLTLWILVHGYRIATGQSREPMMALVTDALKAVLVIGIATGAAAGSGSIYRTLTQGLSEVVAETITGEGDGGPYADIDRTLAIMQVALAAIDSVDSGDRLLTDKRRTGRCGSRASASAALRSWRGNPLLNKVAVALVVGLGPSSACACCSAQPSSCSPNGSTTASARRFRWRCSR